MSDSLRDRIAAVLYRIYPPYQLGYTFGSPTETWDDESDRCKDVYRRDADAVIAVLGLQQEWFLPAEGTKECRYVTEWQPDE